jgi:hypothetical protein
MLKSKNQIAKAQLQANERLKAIINALKNTIIDNDNSVRTIDRNAKLDAKCVKYSLEEILGSQGAPSTSMAHVILDESGGHLFSRNNLVAEEAASVACLRKMQSIFHNNTFMKPIILITSDSERPLQIRIVVFLFDEFTNNVSIYFIDPLNCNKDILNQLKSGLFVRYLKDGSIHNGLSPLLDTFQFKSNENQKLCDREEHSGWWCLFYAFLIIHERNDSFLASYGSVDNNNQIGIRNEQLGRLKNILSTHIDFLSKIDANLPLEQQITRIDSTGTGSPQNHAIDLSKSAIQELVRVDVELRAASKDLETSYEKRMQQLEKESNTHRIENLKSRKQALLSTLKRKQQEIASLESNILQVQALSMCASNSTCAKSGDTTQAKYKRFITGEEKQMIEARVEKNQNARRRDILAQGDERKSREIEEECRLLKEKATKNEYLMRDKEKELKEIKNSLEELEKQIADKMKNVCNYIRKCRI